jgi:dTDP-glucose pyrophosphorylase
MLKKNWKKTLLLENSTIRKVIKNLEKSALQIVLVIDKKKNLVGTITDGDIRRGLLNGLNISSPIKKLINKKPLIGSSTMSTNTMNQIMQTNKINQLPIVDKSKKIVGLYFWDAIKYSITQKSQVIIMAGGKGKRMMPHTKTCPKPLLPVGGKPILEHILLKARSEGFNNFIISINYLGEMIEDYFGNGSKWGVKIKYLKENMPLGTIGALSLIKNQPNFPFIVCNGDIISDIKYTELLDFHIKNKAFGTVAVKPYEIKNPYGVVKIDGNQIVDIEEKPIVKSHVNTGVYVFSPKIINEIKKNKYLDMNILIQKLLGKMKKIIAYPAYEPWLDIGKPKDLKKNKFY